MITTTPRRHKSLKSLSHEEFITVLKEKDKYEKMKENKKNTSKKLEEKQENTKLNGVNSRQNNQFATGNLID